MNTDNADLLYTPQQMVSPPVAFNTQIFFVRLQNPKPGVVTTKELAVP